MGDAGRQVSRALPLMQGPGGASRVRWLVVAAVFLLAFVTIVDRVCISSAKSAIARDLKITDIQFGWVFGAFTLGYAALMIPAGSWADRLGPRGFLAVIVCCWSLLTASTGLAASLTPLICVRFLFGLAEAGSYPTASRALYSWMPPAERGSALGLLNTGSRLGAAVGLPIASYIVLGLGWRSCFRLLGVIGLLWAIWWYCWYRNDPAQKGGVSREELEYIQRCSGGDDVTISKRNSGWGRIVFSLSGGLLLFQYFANNFSFFLVYSWMLPYLQQHFKVDSAMAGVYSGLPMYGGVVATWMGGLIVDSLFRSGYGRWSRALPAIAGFTVASASVALAGLATSPNWFVIWFGLVVLGLDVTVSSSWTVCSDHGGKHTGAVSGAMNMSGAIGSLACSLAFPYVVQLAGRAEPFFWLAAALNATAAFSWLVLARRS